MKNIAIVAKGPSILKCNSEFYYNFDTIIGVNWPLYTKEYEKFLPKRIDYMITGGNPILSPELLSKYKEDGAVNYSQELADKLKIKKIIMLISHDHGSGWSDYSKPYEESVKRIQEYQNKNLSNYRGAPRIPDLPSDYTMEYYNSNRKNFNLKSFKACTGTKSLEYFSLQKSIKNIFFIGFDANNKSRRYYWTLNRSRLWADHPAEKIIDYVQNLGKIFPDKNYYYISTINFKDYKNFNKVTNLSDFKFT